MSTINNTATATARKDATRPADVEWDAMRKGARLGYPAVNGDMVTQGHADYCAEYGHAVHMEDSEESPWCPRCGDARMEENPATRTAPLFTMDDETAATALGVDYATVIGDAVDVEGTTAYAVATARDWHEEDGPDYCDGTTEDGTPLGAYILAWDRGGWGVVWSTHRENTVDSCGHAVDPQDAVNALSEMDTRPHGGDAPALERWLNIVAPESVGYRVDKFNGYSQGETFLLVQSYPRSVGRPTTGPYDHEGAAWARGDVYDVRVVAWDADAEEWADATEYGATLYGTPWSLSDDAAADWTGHVRDNVEEWAAARRAAERERLEREARLNNARVLEALRVMSGRWLAGWADFTPAERAHAATVVHAVLHATPEDD